MVAMNLMVMTESKLWGFHHIDPEYARMLSDPLRITIIGPIQETVMEATDKLGFSAPWPHQIESEMAKLTEAVLRNPDSHHHECSHESSLGI